MTDWAAALARPDRTRKTASGSQRKRQTERHAADGGAVRRHSRGAGVRAVARETQVHEVAARDGCHASMGETSAPRDGWSGEVHRHSVNAPSGVSPPTIRGPQEAPAPDPFSRSRPGTAERIVSSCAAAQQSRLHRGSFSTPVTDPSSFAAAHKPLPPGGARPVSGKAPLPPNSGMSLGHVSADIALWAANLANNRGAEKLRSARGDHGAPEAVAPNADLEQPMPPRPTTPCMNRGGDGARRKRTSSAGAGGRSGHSARGARPASGSVGSRISELESALLARSRHAVASSTTRPGAPEPWGEVFAHCAESRSGRESVLGNAPDADSSPLPPAVAGPAGSPAGAPPRTRPMSSGGCASNAPPPHGGAPLGGINAPASLIEEAMAMCRGARSNAAAAQQSSACPPSPHPMHRPDAPTPEQTAHWLHGIDQSAEHCTVAAADVKEREGRSVASTAECPSGTSAAGAPKACLTSRSGSPDSPRVMTVRPRSPTPTKMLAWEEARAGQATTSVGDSEHEDQDDHYDHTDGLIAQLIGACQLNDINKALTFYEKLRQMRVPLYEGVYKIIIECCMRTGQLGHAMQFYETLKSSGQHVSSRLAVYLMEACAKEQHGDKVYVIWSDWCPPGTPLTASDSQVLLVAVSALLRTMSPDLALSVLQEAIQRSGDRLGACLSDAEVELEELVLLNEQVTEEAAANGTLLEDLAGRLREVGALLEGLHQQCLHTGANQSVGRAVDVDHLFMEDVDCDLDSLL